MPQEVITRVNVLARRSQATPGIDFRHRDRRTQVDDNPLPDDFTAGVYHNDDEEDSDPESDDSSDDDDSSHHSSDNSENSEDQDKADSEDQDQRSQLKKKDSIPTQTL